MKLKIYTDGGARGNPGPAACAFIAINDGETVYEKAYYLGKQTNNFAEYKGVDKAMDWLLDYSKDHRVDSVEFVLDSQLVVNQLRGNYRVKSKNLIDIFLRIKNKEKLLVCPLKYTSVMRENNVRSDQLLNNLLDSKEN